MDSSTLFCVCFFTDWIGEACKSWRLWKCKGEISLPVVSKGFKASLFFFFSLLSESLQLSCVMGGGTPCQVSCAS